MTDLFDFDWTGPPEKERKFAEFDAEHPQIWHKFVYFTFQLIDAGRRQHSARDVIHRIRWDTALRADDGSGFRINDHWSPYYARKFHRQFPQYSKFFETRRVKADKEAA